MSATVYVTNDPLQPGTFALEKCETLGEAHEQAKALYEDNEKDGRRYYAEEDED